MRDRTLGWLIFVVVIAVVAALVSTANLEYQRPKDLVGEDRTQPVWAKLLFWQAPERRTVRVAQGLDLQGGLQVVLEADVPPDAITLPACRTPSASCYAVRRDLEKAVAGDCFV